MPLREETIDATTDDGEMVVVVKQPDGEPAGGGAWPTVAIFIDAPGLRPATHEFMARLAEHGYRVVTPDLHHRNGRLLHFEPKDFAEDPSRREIVRGWIGSMTDDQIQHDFQCALRTVGVADDAKVGVIGFCLGARAVYRAMERHPDRVACGAGWHPSFLADDEPDSPHLTAGGLDRPLYLGIGEADEVQSIAMHQRFLDAVADLPHVDVTTFPGADHGYTWPGYPSYDENAAETSWSKTLAMLESALRT
ncbi:MAG: dienelactone hydrolase family protein [Ilumatobacter sp.]|uniref:dienelactone hydrolase family protein n=1 Tax=Ilumatobacter sp. TaxID=1967498 RepID=UPI002616D4B1|nr:dienelactone hydrolase family protein [Ilumatobacter sp.]MDJ0768495.1 dienelactone hydrolase family protein [Ilumatobacter sp.]